MGARSESETEPGRGPLAECVCCCLYKFDAVHFDELHMGRIGLSLSL